MWGDAARFLFLNVGAVVDALWALFSGKKEVACGEGEKQATSDQKTIIRISRGG
jgi:hypothetical protein